jgi:ABC-2 type transport system ATP-binding protein
LIETHLTEILSYNCAVHLLVDKSRVKLSNDKIALSVSHLVKRYQDTVAVDDVSFDVVEGSCFGLLGPNGAGKTTTLELLEQVIHPDSGDISYCQLSDQKSIQQHIGIQFQETAIQDYMRVHETLSMFAALYGQSVVDPKLIELCNLESIFDRYTKKLSGGQRQRLLLALALIHEPQIVFLDEPTTGLDPQSRQNFWQLIKKIKQAGKTVVLTTHYMEEAEVLCDDIAIMDAGKIIARGKPETLLSQHFQGVIVKLPRQNIAVADLPFDAVEEVEWISFNSVTVDSDLKQLMDLNISLEGLNIHRPNLNDLFLKLTGNQLRE